VIYLDTSSLIKLYLLEDGSKAVNDLVSSQYEPLPIWEIQEVELINALNLKVFWKELTRKQSSDQINLYHDRKKRGLYYMPDISRSELVRKFHDLSQHTQKLGCRTLDILHVACASLLNPELFVSFDHRQCALAKEAGLKVWKI